MPTEPLVKEIERAFPERPFTIELWDGSKVPSTNGGGPTFRARSKDALAYAVAAPGQLGLGRAYVAGEIEIDDMDGVIGVLNEWKPPPVGATTKARLIAAALRAAGVRRPPPPPKAEMHLRGRKHTTKRDREAVRHHYDVGNEFFSLFLDESMTYSCAIFSRGAKSARRRRQDTKLELVCTKLGLKPGQRVLDVGCGWGSFVIHAAQRHGVEAVGITLSENQAELGPEAGRRGRRLRQGRDPRPGLPRARRRGLRRRRLDRDGRARRRVADRRLRRAARLDAPARRPPAQPRHLAAAARQHRGRPVLRALRLPRRRDDPRLPRDPGAGAGGIHRPARRGVRLRLRRDPAPLDPQPRRATSSGPRSWPARSGSASGASTCAPRATASRSTSPRSTRSSADWATT